MQNYPALDTFAEDGTHFKLSLYRTCSQFYINQFICKRAQHSSYQFPAVLRLTRLLALTDEFLSEAKGSYFSILHWWQLLTEFMPDTFAYINHEIWLNKLPSKSKSCPALEANGADTSHFPRLTILNDLYSVCRFNLALAGICGCLFCWMVKSYYITSEVIKNDLCVWFFFTSSNNRHRATLFFFVKKIQYHG